MALISETGAVGILLFALFLGAIGTTFARRWRATPPAARRWACAAAAAGAVLIGQCFVDWLWEIPGLAGLGVLALGLAVAWLDLPEHAPQPRERAVLARRAVTVVLVLAALVVTAIYLSDFHVRQARAAGRAVGRASSWRPPAAPARLNPLALPPKLLQAGALEELGRVGEARDALEQARRLEPENFVIYGLIGDLETRARRRRRGAARVPPRARAEPWRRGAAATRAPAAVNDRPEAGGARAGARRLPRLRDRRSQAPGLGRAEPRQRDHARGGARAHPRGDRGAARGRSTTCSTSAAAGAGGWRSSRAPASGRSACTASTSSPSASSARARPSPARGWRSPTRRRCRSRMPASASSCC